MDREIISNIKSLGIDMIHQAKSGHPGIVLGAAPMIYTVFANHLNINTNDPKWLNRDRFIMSAGHGSALLYATMFMAGYNMSIDDLKKFRQIGSITPGHPEYGVTDGIEMSTGPLGQGIASAVGCALGGKILDARYHFQSQNRFDKNTQMFDYHVYVLCGDGDLMEGISYEACSFAGAHELDNLIVLYDSNNISLDGQTSHTFTEDVLKRFEAMGWDTFLVKDGESVNDIDKAIGKAKSSNKPAIIEVRTTIGKDSLLEGTNAVHGRPLDDADIAQIKAKLNLSNVDFSYSQNLQMEFKKKITSHSSKKYQEWSEEYRKYVADNLGTDASEFDFLFDKERKIDFTKLVWDFETIEKEALRDTNQRVMNELATHCPDFIGGSADLATSTMASLTNFKDITSADYNGRNIWFGVREHAMGAILNGLSLTKFRTFGSTFLAFSDYIKPAIRLSALMNLPVTYIFTHDSISIGSDGPTHQPVEQLAMLRSIPNVDVYRPADAKELIGAWQMILNEHAPHVLIVTKTEIPVLEHTSMEHVSKGGYIVRKESTKCNGIIIATGTEVHTALLVAHQLYEKEQIDIRVVSMPCRESYLRQSKEYQESILPMGYKKVVMEAGVSMGWESFVYNSNYLITVNEFGLSGSKDDILKARGFDYQTILDRVKKLLR